MSNMDRSLCFYCEDTCCKSSSDHLITCQECNQVEMCQFIYDIGAMDSHRPQGLAKCMPFRVSHKEGVGRILVASREIRAGEVVILDRAAAVMPDNVPVCLNCLSYLQPQHLRDFKCDNCKLPFCSDKCRTNELHKEECSILSKSQLPFEVDDCAKPHFVYQCVAILRVVLAQKKSPFVKLQLSKLMTHNEVRIQRPQLYDAIKKMSVFFVTNCGADPELFSEAELWRTFGLIETNSLGFGNIKARGIYPMVSLLSHDCTSNLFPISNPGEAVAFKSKRTILKDEELSIRYTNFIESKLKIRATLKNNWFFDCNCKRCQDPTDNGTYVSSPKCFKCSEGYYCPVVPLDPETYWECRSCQDNVSGFEILNVESRGREILSSTPDNAKILETIAKLLELFSPNHFLIILLKMKFVMTSYTDRKLNEIKVNFAKSILPTMEKLEGGKAPSIGQIARELAKTEITMLTDDKASGVLTQEEYVKRLKPLILLQMEAKKIST